MEEENMVQDESSSQEYEGEGQYSEEEVDRIADTAIEAIQDILKYFNVGEVTIEEYEGDEGELILDITGDDLAVLIGRHGRTLDSLQFLISSITSRIVGHRYPIVVDVEGSSASEDRGHCFECGRQGSRPGSQHQASPHDSLRASHRAYCSARR